MTKTDLILLSVIENIVLENILVLDTRTGKEVMNMWGNQCLHPEAAGNVLHVTNLAFSTTFLILANCSQKQRAGSYRCSKCRLQVSYHSSNYAVELYRLWKQHVQELTGKHEFFLQNFVFFSPEKLGDFTCDLKQSFRKNTSFNSHSEFVATRY